MAEYRRTQPNRMGKEDLINIYLRGVRQPNGHVIASASPASALRKWRKEEIVTSLLEIGWPGSPQEHR